MASNSGGSAVSCAKGNNTASPTSTSARTNTTSSDGHVDAVTTPKVASSPDKDIKTSKEDTSATSSSHASAAEPINGRPEDLATAAPAVKLSDEAKTPKKAAASSPQSSPSASSSGNSNTTANTSASDKSSAAPLSSPSGPKTKSAQTLSDQPEEAPTAAPAPEHRPQAYPPLSALPKVHIKDDAAVFAQEFSRSEMNSSCYPLPFFGRDGERALAVIPGSFHPGSPRPDVFGKPATVSQRMVNLQKQFWKGHGWARKESLAGHGSDSRPDPVWAPANVTNEELDVIDIIAFQIIDFTFVPQWATDYPFALLYDESKGFAFPLLDLDELEDLGYGAPPLSNHQGARFMAMIFAPFDPFDRRTQDTREHTIPMCQHPWRINKLNEDLDRAEAAALHALLRIFG